VLTSDVFYKMDSSKDTDMKRKVFPQSLPRERDSYQLFIRHHHISLSVILFTYIWALSSKTLQWNLATG